MITGTTEKELIKIAEKFLKEKIENEFLNIRINELNLTLDFKYKDYITFDWVGETDILNRECKIYGLGYFKNEIIKFTMMDDEGNYEIFTIKL